MQFPIDITFKMLGWRADIHLTDAAGEMIGYMPPPKERGRALVYASESMGPPIYAIRSEHALIHWFEDASGQRIGEYGVVPTAQGKFVSVGNEPRFQFVYESEWLDFFDSLVPSLPVLNGLTGLFLRPRTLAVRTPGGTNALRIVKKRLMIDVRYTLYALEEMSGRECECLMLSAIVYALIDHNLRTIS